MAASRRCCCLAACAARSRRRWLRREGALRRRQVHTAFEVGCTRLQGRHPSSALQRLAARLTAPEGLKAAGGGRQAQKGGFRAPTEGQRCATHLVLRRAGSNRTWP